MKKITAKFPQAKILVADDYPINLELTTEMLRMMKCKVDTAETGNEAIGLYKRNEYDIIFMDVQMPDLDGYEATRQIRQNETGEKRTIIIAITANALSGDKEKCLEAGMDDYISKPIKGEYLETMLSKYIKTGK
ncbi:MAG: putative two-component response regulator [Rickettsiaceae bacterium]|jgi:CheY-like chemotaxis protein|nr:putative two-component response regulator [Rickettsiaceae bacterium]